ncbi:hypothetical protein N643_02320 [Salmonella bongori serovar 48:z41:-- str. RKS3044]|nr:hypothetical protein N643_02320 [Salmonella bongori serovar 48:z41:-- str. RKS3044]
MFSVKLKIMNCNTKHLPFKNRTNTTITIIIYNS